MTCASSVDLDPPFTIEPGTFPGSATLPLPLQVTGAIELRVTANGYLGPATSSVSVDALFTCGGFLLAMDRGIWHLTPGLECSQVVAVDDQVVTAIASDGSSVYWGQSDKTGVGHVALNDLGSVQHDDLAAHVRGLCTYDWGYLGGGYAALLDNGVLTKYDVASESGWHALGHGFGVQGNHAQLATIGLYFLVATEDRLATWNVMNPGWEGNLGRSGGLAYPLGSESEMGLAGLLWLDLATSAVRVAGDDDPTLCSARPVTGGCLASDRVGDPFWLENPQDGGTQLWRYSQTTKSRVLVWSTPHLASHLTVMP